MRFFPIVLIFFLVGCASISNGKIKYHRVNSARNQVDTMQIANTANLILALNTCTKTANNRVEKEQNHSKLVIQKNTSRLKQGKLDNIDNNGQKTLTDNSPKRILFVGASNHNRINPKLLNLNSEKKSDTLYITLAFLGVLAIIALVFLGIIYLGLGYPVGGAGALTLAFLILLTIILVTIIRERKPNKRSNEQAEKQEKRRKFWRVFGATIGVVGVIVLTILLL